VRGKDADLRESGTSYKNNEIGDAGKNTVEVLLVVLQVGCIEVRYYAL
jgi:hypothetical protein